MTTSMPAGTRSDHRHTCACQTRESIRVCRSLPCPLNCIFAFRYCSPLLKAGMAIPLAPGSAAGVAYDIRCTDIPLVSTAKSHWVCPLSPKAFMAGSSPIGPFYL